MNAYEEELREKWGRIKYYDGGSLQLSFSHPLEWHVRYVTEKNKSLVIVSDTPADGVPSSLSIEASCNRRKDGRYAISFTLVNPDQEDVFISMAGDIIEYSRNEPSGRGSLKKVLSRYAQWLKLLDHKRSELLRSHEQKGLLAELLFLGETMDSGKNVIDALAGWVGPEGADQDFVYSDGWHEIKAVGLSADKVGISSVEQLDAAPPGELIIYRIDKCAPEHAGALTLYREVHCILSKLEHSQVSAESFLLKLAAVGYIDKEEYDQQCFAVSSKQVYSVDAGFPKLSRSALPVEVIAAEYQISLPGIADWLK